MAEALWLVTRNQVLGRQDFDDIHSVLINADDAGSAADTIQDAVDLVNAQLPSSPDNVNKLPDGYFDAAAIVSDLIAGPLSTDGDGYVMGRVKASLVT